MNIQHHFRVICRGNWVYFGMNLPKYLLTPPPTKSFVFRVGLFFYNFLYFGTIGFESFRDDLICQVNQVSNKKNTFVLITSGNIFNSVLPRLTTIWLYRPKHFWPLQYPQWHRKFWFEISHLHYVLYGRQINLLWATWKLNGSSLRLS